MSERPRVLLAADVDPAVRMWLLESGAEVVEWGEADEAGEFAGTVGVTIPGLPSLVGPDQGALTRADVRAFVQQLRGRPDHRFDDHGSTQAWPRGSY